MANVNSGGGQRNVTPKFKATVAGQEIQQSDTKGLVYLSIEDHLDMIGVAQISINIGGMKWKGMEVGAEVEVEVGQTGRKMFKGNITSLRHSWQKGNEVLTIVAHDPLIKMASSRETKVYGEDPYTSPSKKDSEIVSAVIGAAGCSAGKVDDTKVKHKYVFQRNESHYNFCKRLASRNGYLLRANEGKIDFIKAEFGGETEIGQEMLLSLDYQLDPSQVPKNLTVIGWDYNAKEKVEGTAASGDIVTIGGGENVGSKNGETWAADSYISDVLVTTQSGAKEMAVGELNRLARRFMRGRAVIQGNGEINAGSVVKFKGLFEKFNPTALVVSTRHIVEPTRGFTTEIQFCGNTWPT